MLEFINYLKDYKIYKTTHNKDVSIFVIKIFAQFKIVLVYNTV